MAILPEVRQHYGRIKNYVDGAWVDSESQEALDILNPATGKSIGQVPLSTAAEVDEAVKAAHEAFADWRSTPSMARAQYLFRLKELVTQHLEELARILVQEEGKSIDDARGELNRPIAASRFIRLEWEPTLLGWFERRR